MSFPDLPLIYAACGPEKFLVLGFPWIEKPTYNKTVNVKAFADVISVCFVKNSVCVYFCISLKLESLINWSC